jgi:hypothetical protein
MSKGSRPRPYSVSNEEYDRRWDAIFGTDKDKKIEDSEQPKSDDKSVEVKDTKVLINNKL